MMELIKKYYNNDYFHHYYKTKLNQRILNNVYQL